MSTRIDWFKLAIWAGMVLVSLALWAGLFLGISRAVGAPSLQTRADVTADWMAETLHASVPHRTITVYDALPFNRAGQMHEGGAVDLSAGVARDIALIPVWRGAYVVLRFTAGHVLVHELLHRPETSACWGAVEEGVVDAVALDLLPAWGKRFLRSPVRGISPYPAEVAAIRAASARATGSATWRSREARTWRRVLWGASCDGRLAMLGAIG